MGTKRKETYRNGEVILERANGWYVASFRHVGKRKRKQLVLQTRPEQEAKAALDRFAESLRAVRAQQTSYTIGDLWALWLSDREKDGLRNDIYKANWVSLRKAFESRAPHLLTADDCREYAKARFASGRAPATVNTELVRLRACLQWAESEGKIAKAPRVWAPSSGKPRERVLSPDEGRRLVEAAYRGDPHIALFVVLAFATGGRHVAILDLTWDRVDFNAGTIELDDDLPPDPMHKTWRKGRATVWMSELARRALTLGHSGRQTKYVIEHGGRRLKTVREGFANAAERAGLGTDVTPHTIRHTVATWADEKNVRASELLGHRDERTTRMVYTHPGAEVTRPAVEVINATLAALPELPEPRAGQGGKRVKKRRLKSDTDNNRSELS